MWCAADGREVSVDVGSSDRSDGVRVDQAAREGLATARPMVFAVPLLHLIKSAPGGG
jgi:hypothetical protein